MLMMVRKHSFSFISPNGKVRSTPSLSPAFPKINSESLVPNFKSLELMLGYKGPFLHYKHIYIYINIIQSKEKGMSIDMSPLFNSIKMR